MGIDNFLNELFGPTAAPPPPASFADRFGALDDGGAMLPPNAQPTSGAAPSDLMGRLAGLPRPRPPAAGPSAADLSASGPPMNISPDATAGPPQEDGGIMSRLLSLTNPGMAADDREAGGPQKGDPRGVLGRLLGFDQTGEKRLRSSLSAGFAGGNPAFKGGAFMQGASGALKGGLASDEQEQQQQIAADAKKLQQTNFERQQGDKELTSAALRKLYGDRGEAMVTTANNRANPRASTAWAKPPHERYKDAMHLIQAERKALYGQINAFGAKADQVAARAEADAKLKAFTDRTLRTYGIDENGRDTGSPGAPATPGGPRSDTRSPPAPDGVEYDSSAISGAREAIARGANPDQVKQRLKENGITFADEDLAL